MQTRYAIYILAMLIMFVELSQAAPAQNRSDTFDTKNAAHWYKKVILKYDDPNIVALKKYIADETPLTPKIEAFLEKQKTALDLIVKASQIENCDWEYDRFNADPGQYQFTYTDPYHRTKYAILLLADIKRTEKNNSHTIVFKRLKALFNLNRHLDSTHPVARLASISMKGYSYKYILNYLNRKLELTAQELSGLYDLLIQESKVKISLDAVLKDQLHFARIAVKEKPDFSDEPDWRKILNVKGEVGKEEFRKSCLDCYESYISQLREALKAPLVFRGTAISSIESSYSDKIDAFIEKDRKLPANYVPTEKDYIDFIENCGYAFIVLNDPLLEIMRYYKNKSNNLRNALMAGLLVRIEYSKTGKLSNNILPNSPVDAFGRLPFKLVKTDSGFKIMSQSIDVRKDKKWDYEFKRPLKKE